MARKSISQKTRFEVFKRDKFTCQYCGKKAPDVVLHLDHIIPVAEGGQNDLMNLVAACAGCNGGKGARRLDDSSVVERQRVQIEELEERRQQLEMLLRWRESLASLKESEVDQIADYIGTKARFVLNENGKKHVRAWLKKFAHDDILAAIDTSYEQYLKYDDNDAATQESWEHAFNKVPSIITWTKKIEEKPHLKQMFYIRGILRRRLHYVGEHQCLKLMEEFHELGGDLDGAQEAAKQVRNWTQWEDAMCSAIDYLKQQTGESVG